MPVPQSIEELEHFLETHPEFGKINGEELVEYREDVAEISNAFVKQDIYNKAMLRGTVLTYPKSQIATTALTLFLTDGSIYSRDIVPKPADPGWYTIEFPCFVPGNLYDQVCSRAEEIGFSQSDLMTYALDLFANNPGINARYDKRIKAICQLHNVNEKYVELKVLGWLKLKGREKRLKMSLEAGRFITRAKLP